MDRVRELIVGKLKERGLSMKEVSTQIGRNHAYLQQFLERGVPANLPEGVRGQLAIMLGVTEDALRGPSPALGGRLPMAKSIQPLPLPLPGATDRIPVLGMAECGIDGWSLWNGEIVDWVPRPANLVGAQQAYAVFIVGISMEPRYYPGEVVFIHPGRPVTLGAFVLVQIRPKEDGEPPRAVIKRLVKRSGTKWVLEQFSPAKTFEIKSEEIVSIHRVVGSGET